MQRASLLRICVAFFWQYFLFHHCLTLRSDFANRSCDSGARNYGTTLNILQVGMNYQDTLHIFLTHHALYHYEWYLLSSIIFLMQLYIHHDTISIHILARDYQKQAIFVFGLAQHSNLGSWLGHSRASQCLRSHSSTIALISWTLAE